MCHIHEFDFRIIKEQKLGGGEESGREWQLLKIMSNEEMVFFRKKLTVFAFEKK